MKKTLALVIALMISSTLVALAHSGGTDSNGGHINHKDGTYHYHKRK